MSGKIAVGGGIPKGILSRSSAALRAPLIFARSFLERVLRKFKTRSRRTLPMHSRKAELRIVAERLDDFMQWLQVFESPAELAAA